MIGKENKPWQIKIKDIPEEEIELFIEKLSPEAGWAYQETETSKELILYYYTLPSEETLKDIGKTIEISESPSWEEKFRETFKGTKVGNFFVRPPWIKERKDLINIIIYPASGFGTGEHETTKGMLLMIEKILNKITPQLVLDVGTGSGILAIACSKLKALKIVALDKDELAISNAKQNLLLNSITNVKLVTGTLETIKGSFDLVLANIDFFTLIENAKNLKRVIRKDGYLILSGFLEEDMETLFEVFFKLNFKLVEVINLKQWITGLLRNSN